MPTCTVILSTVIRENEWISRTARRNPEPSHADRLEKTLTSAFRKVMAHVDGDSRAEKDIRAIYEGLVRDLQMRAMVDKIAALEAELVQSRENEANPLHWERKVNRVVGELLTEHRADIERAAREQVAIDFCTLRKNAARLLRRGLYNLVLPVEAHGAVRVEAERRSLQRIGERAGIVAFGALGAVASVADRPWEEVGEPKGTPIVVDFGVRDLQGKVILPVVVRYG